MKLFKNNIKFTTAQFAKLNHINKRTLQYYDNIGLFSPVSKGENNYRYYDFSQIMELDYILMLRKLGMSIEEIKNYLKSPTSDNFLNIANIKIPEIDSEIKRLQMIKEDLKYKKEILTKCANISNDIIEICECDEEYLLVTKTDVINNSLEEIYNYLRETTNTDKQKLGYGSFINWNKILDNNYSYDGVFTCIKSKDNSSNIFIKEKGKYLCAYRKGSWKQLPLFYNKIIEFIKINNIKLIGYAYEFGLNDFVTSSADELITKITIKVKEN